MAHRAVKTLVLIGVMGLAACSNNNRFGDGTDYGAGAAGGYGAGDASNPNSPAYFQAAVGDRVLFPVDQSTLTDVARGTLDAQAAWMNTNTAYNAQIEGHADEQGTREYNLALGARRANSVQEYLISRGVAGTRLNTVSYGKERPLEICSEEACYAKNRRAVTVLQAAAGS
ncbi:peptidoglycan-associated lipoprotein Pal [Aliiruegeria sabulilitoris]|uniref:peptidoglycan-associated lipoprotein Pal n=1 Tax=Aliiruegeria sabulilitoris TaxID=1510458 RepID=UPI000830DC99|nr:peptidoglycan-associated lipoprotein Pal [Aliiruegeria sabulilitoris]NDR55969.1 peptidoglycan-associated lipoprotein Pal [Pseudoruegeria sp. M32A2M]